MSAILQGRHVPRDACLHADGEPLGSDGNADFFRCPRCRGIVLAQGGRMWVIATIAGGPENQDASFGLPSRRHV